MSFSGDIKKYTDSYRRKMNFVAKDATQRVVTDAQTPVGLGGRFPIDTGFARASLVAAINTMPSGPTQGIGESLANNQAIGDNVTAQLIRWNPASEEIFIGWSASYIRYIERDRGFLRGATERWPEFVRRAVNAADRNNL